MAAVIERQDGVIDIDDLRRVGVGKSDVERMLRRRELVRVHRRVYVDHTGPLTPVQTEWAAVLAVRGSALADESALAAARRRSGHRQPEVTPVQVAVNPHRRVTRPAGVLVRYVSGLDRQVLWNTLPPRMKPEYAALRVASRTADRIDAVARLTEVLSARLTTAPRLCAALSQLPSLPQRAWLGPVVDDLASGLCSTLEHGYLDRVERAHGLPRPDRQSSRRGTGGTQYRDVEYDPFGLVVELDGRAFHDSPAARERDYGRDLDDHVAAKESVRLTWGQVYRESCSTAGKVARILQRRGWDGQPTPCGPACAMAP